MTHIIYIYTCAMTTLRIAMIDLHLGFGFGIFPNYLIFLMTTTTNTIQRILLMLTTHLYTSILHSAGRVHDRTRMLRTAILLLLFYGIAKLIIFHNSNRRAVAVAAGHQL